MKRAVGTFRIAVLGGDKRLIYAAQALAEYGMRVSAWGNGGSGDFRQGVSVFSDWREAVKSGDCLLLPLPATVDGVHLHSPLAIGGVELRLDTLFDAAEGKMILGGRLSDIFVRQAEERGLRCIDYFTSEILQRKNALPTVEGAIEIAMRSLPSTIFGSKMAVIGYGRLGELLCYKLRLLGAEVTVYARREEALCRAEQFGCKTELLGGPVEETLSRLDPQTRVVFHTVPVCLFTKNVLKSIPNTVLHIDLASAPGGIDRIAAEALGIQTVWATSLPGKYAPETAGKIIADTIETILRSVKESSETDDLEDTR